MNRKERLYAVIGGCVGAILTIAVCSLSPLGAQSQSDVSFGKIMCRQLEVVSSDETKVVEIYTFEGGGAIHVLGKDGKIRVAMNGSEGGGSVSVNSKGGLGSVGGASVSMTALENVGIVNVIRRGSWAGMDADGSIFLHDQHGNARIIAPYMEE